MAVLVVLFAFILSAGLTRALLSPDSRIRILDHPNERSLHDVPVPRTGGIGMLVVVFGAFAAVALTVPPFEGMEVLFGSTLAIAVLSFLDDRFTLGAGTRLLVHVGAAVCLLAGGFMPVTFELPGLVWWWSVPSAWIFGVLFVVWLTNLYNFMDGMDGFAGGMAVFGFATYAVLGALSGNTMFALLNMVVAASAAGFLLFNFPPAKIFMGDVGASTLGFLVAAFSLWADRDGLFPLWISLLVFSPFVVDATITLFRRLLRVEKVWEAHKSHYYQRLVQLGWGHRRTVLAEYGLMMVSAVSAILAMRFDAASQWLIGLIWIAIYVTAMAFVHFAERKGV